MNQITLILYSNPKDPTKSVIPNNKKIVLEKDNLDILEDIRCQLQFETETFHLFNAGALIRVSQKTKNVITIEDGTKINGLGTAIEELIVENNLQDIKFEKQAWPDEFLKQGTEWRKDG